MGASRALVRVEVAAEPANFAGGEVIDSFGDCKLAGCHLVANDGTAFDHVRSAVMDVGFDGEVHERFALHQAL